MRIAVTMIAMLALAGCGEGEPGAGGVTPDEDRQLDEASAMLDERTEAAALPDANAAEPEPEQP